MQKFEKFLYAKILKFPIYQKFEISYIPKNLKNSYMQKFEKFLYAKILKIPIYTKNLKNSYLPKI